MKQKTIFTFWLMVFFAFVAYAVATPIGPISLAEGQSTRADLSTTVKNLSAQAGNVTEVNISFVSITKAWQGYYGSITAEIVLADSSNNQFYNWSIASPAGEIFASPNSSVTWADINCFNFSANGTPTINQSIVESESWFNISSSAADRFDQTFNLTTHDEITVGSVVIGTNTCPSTYVFDNTGWQTTRFQNLLLTDNSSLVFATILEDDTTGFDSATYDFQMLVAENGHGSASSTLTTYYFWVEIS